MTKRSVSKGACEGCKAVLSKSAVTRHLANCPASASKPGATVAGRTPLFHLLVEARGATMYWLHIEMPADATLAALDAFLRRIWLECCGHLSMFRIDGVTYTARPKSESFGFRESEEKGLRSRVDSVLGPGDACVYSYDFGSTTELVIRVAGASEGAPRGTRLLARNLPPDIACSVCDRTATSVCTACMSDLDGWLCARCVKNHGCGEEYLLPVVNSPRVGVCGYSG